MAATKKHNHKGKNSRTSAKNTKNDIEYSFRTEILFLVFLAVSILLLISNFGKGGLIGNAISNFCFGTMGILTYIFPILLFILSAFLIANKGNALAYKKAIAGIVFFIFFCGLLQLLTEGYTQNTTFEDYFTLCADFHTGGGVIGGMVCTIFSSAFSVTGTYIIIIFVLIISFILLTQKSLFCFLLDIAEGIGNLFKDKYDQYLDEQTERELRREMREEKRRQRKEERMWEMEEFDDEETQPSYSGKSRRQSQDKDNYNDSISFSIKSSSKKNNPTPPKKETLKASPKSISKKAGKTNQKEQFLTLEEEMEAAMNADDFEVESMITRQGQMEFRIQRSTPEKINEEETEDISFEANDIPEFHDLPEFNDIQTPSEEFPKTELEKLDFKIRELMDLENPKPENSKVSQTELQNIQTEIAKQNPIPKAEYQFPPLKLLNRGNGNKSGDSDDELRKTAQKLQDTLHNFGVNVTITDVSCGPTVTRYELQPEMGVKVSRIVNLVDDIKLNLAAPDIRIEAPIPGKAAVGIEVPNKENTAVMLRDLIQSQEFSKSSSKLSFAVGKDIAGKTVVTDIAKMPHLLIAGATGSGKSVCINTIIISLLYKATPDEVKMIMIDPKVVELNVYNGIPHLLIPVVTDPKKAAGALNWAVAEMMKRYNTFAECGVRNISEYNRKIEQISISKNETVPERMPQIVIIVDELADLMMVASGEVESAICRIAQLARAAGIHLIIATQRPSVNVITGVIKANMPSRIAFAVSSSVDSRTILDMNGAEKLLGKGDMLFYPQGYSKPVRLQGAFVSDEEVSSIVEFLSNKNPAVQYNMQIEEQVSTACFTSVANEKEERDIYFQEAGRIIIEKERASIGMLQRSFRIGFNRAARIMEQLCDAGVVGPEEGTKPRKVLMTIEEFENLL